MSARVVGTGPSIRRSAGWVVTSTIAVGALNFVYALVLTWFLPVRGYPAFAGTQALLVVCGTGASASVPWMLAHRVAQGSNVAAQRDATSFAVVVTLAQGLLAAAFVATITTGLARGNSLLPVVAAASAFVIFAAATSTGYMQGRQQFGRISFVHGAEAVVKLAVGIALVWLGVGAAGAIVGFGIGAALVVAVGAPGLVRHSRLSLSPLRDRGLWQHLTGLTTIQVGVAVLMNLDIVIGSLLSRQAASLAGYQVSATLSRVPFFLAAAISMAVFAKIAADPAGARSLIQSSSRIFARVAIPVAVATATLPMPIASLFLPHAYPAFVESVLPFTASAGALAATTNLLTTFFQAERRYRACTVTLGLGLAFDLLAVVVGLLSGGVRGLAYGSLVGQTGMALLFWVTSWRTWGTAVMPDRWLVASIVASLPLLALRQTPWVWLGYALLICGVTGWATFVRAPRDAELARSRGLVGRGLWTIARAVARIPPDERRRLGRAADRTAVRWSAARRPRVFLLTSHPVAPPWSGADKNLARALLLADLGADFVFVGDRGDPTAWPPWHERRALAFGTGVPTSREQLRLFWSLYGDRADVDILHAIITFRASLAKESGLLALPVVRRSRLVVTCPSGHHLPLHLLRRASAAVAISRRTEQELLDRGLRNVWRIPPGIDLRRFRPGSAQEGRRRLGLGQEQTVLFAGHHDEGGGLEAALDVFRLLRRRVPSVRLLTAMRTRPGIADQRRRAAFAARIEALGLADAVVPLGDRADVRSAIWASSAVLFQPQSLGIKMDLPMVLLEALACGRPVVVSPVDSLGELADGPPAVVVERPDAPATVDHLERLLTDRAYAGACGDAARALAERRYAVEDMVGAYADLYRCLLGQSPHAHAVEPGAPGERRVAAGGPVAPVERGSWR